MEYLTFLVISYFSGYTYCTCPSTNEKHNRFVKCNTDKKRRHWLNPANMQIHLINQHERFPKRGTKKLVGHEKKLQRLQCAKKSMNDKLTFFFADVNLPHSAIESKAFKKVIQQALDIGKNHKDAKAEDIATFSRRALTKDTSDKAVCLMKLLSDFMKNQLDQSNWIEGRYLSLDCMIDGKGFGQKHAVGLTLVATQFVVDENEKPNVDVYSFVTELTQIKDNAGKTSYENAEYIKQFTKDLLGDHGKHLKCIGDGAVVITYSNKLREELLKEDICQAMAEVLGVCQSHGHILSERATWSRVIQETENTKFATSIQFGKSFKKKNCKFRKHIICKKLSFSLSAFFR